MTDAISETKEKLDILKNAESQVQEQFKKGEVSEEQYKALKRELGRTEVELANLEEAARQTDTAIEELGEIFQTFRGRTERSRGKGRRF